MRVRTVTMVLALAPLFLGIARAEPTIEIRARAVLEVHGSRTDEGEVRIRAVLSDDVGAPIRAARIALAGRLSGASCGATIPCVTDASGACGAVLRGCAADGVAARYEGTSEIDGSEVTGPVIDRGAEPRVGVVVDGGPSIDLDARTVRVRVTMEGIASIPARIALSDELGRTFLQRATTATTELALDVPPREFGPPGLGSVVATVRFEDGSSATGRAMIARRSRSRLSLVRSGDELVARLADGAGPVSGAIVGLTIDASPAGNARTGDDGSARFSFAASDRRRTAQATFHSNDGSRTDATSPRVVLAAVSPPYLRLLLPFVSLAILGVFVRRRTRDDVRASLPTPPRIEAPEVEAAAPSSLLPTHDDLGIRVLAREDGTPLVGATAAFEDGSLVLTADERGVLRIDGAPRGNHRIVVGAGGRIPETIRVRIPHRGEWSAALVRLETPRTHAARAIPVVARAATTNDDERAILTLREADAKLARAEDPEFLADAERAIYGPASPSPEQARAVVGRSHERTDGAAGG